MAKPVYELGVAITHMTGEKFQYSGERKEKFLQLPRTGNNHTGCGHPILDSSLVGAYSCDEINCNNCCSFTVLHLYLDELDADPQLAFDFS